MKRPYPHFLSLLSAALLCSCLGTKTALHMSSSNFGLNIDTTPPTTELGLGRTELAVQPGFSQGRTPSSLMGFSARAKTGGFIQRFMFGTSSVFSTGQAAANLAAASSPAATSQQGVDPNTDTLTLEELDSGLEPKRPSILELLCGERRRTPFKEDEMFPVVCGTKTTYGLNIAWDPSTQTPRSVCVGFNRKELSYAPIVGAVKQPRYKVKLPSVLAVHQQDTTGGAEGTGDDVTQGNLKFDHIQYLATGNAADNLARDAGVKSVLKKQLTQTQPNPEKQEGGAPAEQ